MTGPEDLSRYALFADLTPAQLAAVAPLIRLVTYPVGHRLFEEGRPAEHGWLIRSGQVRLEIGLPNASPITVQTLGSRDVVGWSWLLPPHRWQLDGVVTAELVALQLDAPPFRELAAADTALGYHVALRVAESLSDRLLATRARLVDLYRSPRAV